MNARLPAVVQALVRDCAGTPLRTQTVTGGCINQAAGIDTNHGRVFVKWRQRAPAGFFAAEAEGLRRLATRGGLRVPQVITHVDQSDISIIVMEWVEGVGPSRWGMEQAGHQLAHLHERKGLAPGLGEDNFIGALAQVNGTVPGGWIDFFRQRRLLPLTPKLPIEIRRAIEALPLERLLTEPSGGCCLLHGDLWSGNLIFDAHGAVFVDPAVYAGHPEVDLAMTRLFGGFTEVFYAAYQEIAGPFDEEIEARLDLLNLYPLLVHVALFGGTYVDQVAQAVSRAGGLP